VYQALVSEVAKCPEANIAHSGGPALGKLYVRTAQQYEHDGFVPNLKILCVVYEEDTNGLAVGPEIIDIAAMLGLAKLEKVALSTFHYIYDRGSIQHEDCTHEWGVYQGLKTLASSIPAFQSQTSRVWRPPFPHPRV